MGGSTATTGCSDGCASLAVPFTTYNDEVSTPKVYYSQSFEIYLVGDVDLTAAKITVKAKIGSAKAGGFQIFAKGGEATGYASAYGPWVGWDMASATEFKEFSLDLAAPTTTYPGGTAMIPFDASKIHIIGIQMGAGGPFYLDEAKTMVDVAALRNPTTMIVDHVSITGPATPPPAYSFAADATAFHLGTYQPITGSAVTWIAP